jgi:hypothetical protein
MNYILRILLQLPLLYILYDGVEVVTGRSEWWIIMPIFIALNILYEMGELIKNEEKNDD